MYPSIFDQKTVTTLLGRIDNLTQETTPEWGEMNVGQMLAHNNVAFDIAFGKVPVSYNFIMRIILKMFVKDTVVGNKPYKKNSQTAPIFVISDERDFAKEKAELVVNIKRVHEEGAAAFEGKASPSFGKLTAQEWSNQFWKHLDHHLTQFGV